MYKNGLLAYTTDAHKLRFLSLQDNVSDETVVDVRKLAELTIPQFDCRSEYQLRPVHYSHGIISCLFNQNDRDGEEGWLIFWAIESPAKSLRVLHLQYTYGLFVRNNRSHLYYGAADFADDLGSDGWCLRGFDMENGYAISGVVPLPDFRGMSIGANASFEVIDDFFYGASSEAPNDEGYYVNSTENSFYYAFRFRMGHHDSFQVLPRSRSWRRCNQDGSLDDRWSTLDLVQDETTGAATLYETRKEWSVHRAYSQRFCYRKELDFVVDSGEAICDLKVSTSLAMSIQVSATDLDDGVHAGDCGSNRDTPTFTDMLARWYNPSARCFVDLVKWIGANDRRLLSLRVRPQQNNHLGDIVSSVARSRGLRGEALYGQCGVYSWPPSDLSTRSLHPTDELIDVLEVGGSLTNETRISVDERCIIFSRVLHHSTDPLPPVRLMCFDPGVRLYGHRRLAGGGPLSVEPRPLEGIPDILRASDVSWSYKAQAKYVWIRGSAGCQMGFELDQQPSGHDLGRS